MYCNKGTEVYNIISTVCNWRNQKADKYHEPINRRSGFSNVASFKRRKPDDVLCCSATYGMELNWEFHSRADSESQ